MSTESQIHEIEELILKHKKRRVLEPYNPELPTIGDVAMQIMRRVLSLLYAKRRSELDSASRDGEYE